jgi:hypothetical protein
MNLWGAPKPEGAKKSLLSVKKYQEKKERKEAKKLERAKVCHVHGALYYFDAAQVSIQTARTRGLNTATVIVEIGQRKRPSKWARRTAKSVIKMLSKIKCKATLVNRPILKGSSTYETRIEIRWRKPRKKRSPAGDSGTFLFTGYPRTLFWRSCRRVRRACISLS